MTAHNIENETARAVRGAQARQRAASRNRPLLQFCRSILNPENLNNLSADPVFAEAVVLTVTWCNVRPPYRRTNGKEKRFLKRWRRCSLPSGCDTKAARS